MIAAAHPVWWLSGRLKAPLLVVLTMILGACGREAPQAPVTLPLETVTEERVALNGRSWRAAFDVELTPGALQLYLRIRLVPGPDLNRPQLDRLAADWEEAVENYWSECFEAVRVTNGIEGPYASRPVLLDIEFVPRDAHHTVVVKNDAASRIDQLYWSRWADARVVAHEVGHMLGAFDEYRDGGQDPENPLMNPESVMGGSPAGKACDAHQLTLLAEWLDRRVPSSAGVLEIRSRSAPGS